MNRIDLESLIIGYAKSPLDAAYLDAVGARTWNQAYDQAGDLVDLFPSHRL